MFRKSRPPPGLRLSLPGVRGSMPFLGLLAIAMFIVLQFATVAVAVQPDEVLADPKLEARARALSRELRCMVCQNQSIDDSDAPLARDLRILVRERLKAGDGDAQVLDFLTARYGEFVLLRPPLGWHTALLHARDRKEFGRPPVLPVAPRRWNDPGGGRISPAPFAPISGFRHPSPPPGPESGGGGGTDPAALRLPFSFCSQVLAEIRIESRNSPFRNS